MKKTFATFYAALMISYVALVILAAFANSQPAPLQAKLTTAHVASVQ